MRTMPVQKLKEFDQTYGWIFRWLLMLVLFGILFLADGRYLTRDEAVEKEGDYLAMREADMAHIDNRIDALAALHAGDFSSLDDIKSRLSRIEAQNEIVIRYIERQQLRRETNP